MKAKERYFVVATEGAKGGKITIDVGYPIKDEIRGDVIQVGVKEINLDWRGVCKTNDPETIEFIKNPNTESFINRKTGKIHELFVGVSDLDKEYSELYKINCEEHKKTVNECIEAGLYKFTKKIDTKSELDRINKEEAELLVRKKRLELDKMREEVESGEKIAEAKKKKTN